MISIVSVLNKQNFFFKLAFILVNVGFRRDTKQTKGQYSTETGGQHWTLSGISLFDNR